MVYVVKTPNRGLGYRVHSISNEGPASMVRVLAEEEGFDSVGTIMQYIEALKDGIKNRRYENFRGTLGTSGVRIYDAQNKVLLEEDGHLDGESLQSYIKDLSQALDEGFKVNK